MIKLYFENYSGAGAEIDIDGSVFSIPQGECSISLDESMVMGGEFFVTWDPSGMMMMDSMDADDIMTADSMGNVVFHSVEAAPGESGTLVPTDLLMSGMSVGIVIAGGVMLMLILKKVLLMNHTYD